MKCEFCATKVEFGADICSICKKYLSKPETAIPIMRAHLMSKCPQQWSAEYKNEYINRVMNYISNIKPRS